MEEWLTSINENDSHLYQDGRDDDGVRRVLPLDRVFPRHRHILVLPMEAVRQLEEVEATPLGNNSQDDKKNPSISSLRRNNMDHHNHNSHGRCSGDESLSEVGDSASLLHIGLPH